MTSNSVATRSDFLSALKDKADNIIVEGLITLKEPLEIRHSCSIDGGNLLQCLKGIKIKHVEAITLDSIYVENPGSDGAGDGIELRSKLLSPTHKARFNNINIGKCGDEGISIRGCEDTLITTCKTTVHNHRGIMAFLTDDNKVPPSRWRLTISHCTLEADKRLPNTMLDTSVKYSTIRNWTGDCAKVRGMGRLHYQFCEFHARETSFLGRVIDAIGCRNDALHVVGNDKDNRSDKISQEGCQFFNGAQFR